LQSKAAAAPGKQHETLELPVPEKKVKAAFIPVSQRETLELPIIQGHEVAATEASGPAKSEAEAPSTAPSLAQEPVTLPLAGAPTGAIPRRSPLPGKNPPALPEA
jgi:hypothetical protein